MATRPRTEAAASTTVIVNEIETVAAATEAVIGVVTGAETAAEIAAATAVETEATGAETAVAAATETRLAVGIPPEARPGAIEVGAGAGAVILADTHAVIETTETTTGEALGAAAAARVPVRLAATTAHRGMTAATATTGATVAGMTTAVAADTAPPAIPRRREMSVIAAPSLSSSWPLASVPAS